MLVETIGKCKSCGEMKALARYQKVGGGRFYFRKHCVTCWSAERREYQEGYRAENSEKLAAYDQQKYAANRDQISTAAKRHYYKMQKIVFDRYGNKCACCEEHEAVFLSVDHVNNDGAAHRKKIGAGTVLYRWIIDNGFPNSLQLLCCNCNLGKHRNGGICPHEVARLNSSIKSGA